MNRATKKICSRRLTSVSPFFSKEMNYPRFNPAVLEDIRRGDPMVARRYERESQRLWDESDAIGKR